MDVLDVKQSALLKRIDSGYTDYQSFTQEEKNICKFLVKLGYIHYTTVHRSKSQNGILQAWSEIETISISEEGKMYLLNERLSEEQRVYLKAQMESLNNIAASAKAQSELAVKSSAIAKEESKFARRDAIFSKVISIIAILISIAAIVVPVIY